MNGWIIEGGWWWKMMPPINRAIALFPFILVRKGARNPVLLHHERIHLVQQLEMLILPFYLWYLVEYLWHRSSGKGHLQAYLAISFEREAYTFEKDPAYLTRRRFWAFLYPPGS